MSTTSSVPAKRSRLNGCEASSSGSKRSRVTDSAPSIPGGKTAKKNGTSLLHENDDDYENAIRMAIEERFKSNTSWRKLQQKYKVAESTLRRRYQGGKTRSVGHEAQAHLNADEEQVLVEYCKSQVLLAQPLNALALQQHVWEMSGKKPGEDWIRRFFHRHKDIQMKTARGPDPKRACAFSREIVSAFFLLVKANVINQGVPPSNIYNFDEKGIQLSGGRRNICSKYIFAAEDTNCYLKKSDKKSDNLTLITILECVSATGEACPPVFVLPKGSLPDWLHVSGVGGVCTTEKGRTDDSVTSQWFHKVFIPWAKERSDPTYPVVLFSDGHGSHETPDMKILALDNNVTLISLPPHTTHKLQPLNVGVFASLKRAWGRQCNDLAVTGNEVTRDTVIEMYMNVRQNHMKPETIQAAWHRCGLHPFNPDIFTDADYAPSPLACNQASASSLPSGVQSASGFHEHERLEVLERQLHDALQEIEELKAGRWAEREERLFQESNACAANGDARS